MRRIYLRFTKMPRVEVEAYDPSDDLISFKVVLAGYMTHMTIFKGYHLRKSISGLYIVDEWGTSDIDMNDPSEANSTSNNIYWSKTEYIWEKAP